MTVQPTEQTILPPFFEDFINIICKCENTKKMLRECQSPEQKAACIDSAGEHVFNVILMSFPLDERKLVLAKMGRKQQASFELDVERYLDLMP